MLMVAYEYHTLDVAQSAVLGIENIVAVQLVGDKLQKLLSDWNSILAGQGAPVAKAMLKPLMIRQLRKSQRLKEEIARYGRALPRTYDNSNDWVYRCLVRRTELKRQRVSCTEIRYAILRSPGWSWSPTWQFFGANYT